MPKLDYLIEELVTGNRILAREGVVDSFGHISVRHPDNPQRYLLSRSRAPDCIEKDDIMEFTLDGTAVDARGRAPYLERRFAGAVFAEDAVDAARCDRKFGLLQRTHAAIALGNAFHAKERNRTFHRPSEAVLRLRWQTTGAAENPAAPGVQSIGPPWSGP